MDAGAEVGDQGNSETALPSPSSDTMKPASFTVLSLMRGLLAGVSGLPAVLEDKRPMGLWQQRVDRMVHLVESEGVGARLGPYHLNTPHPACLEDLDQPRVPNRDIEMPGLG